MAATRFGTFDELMIGVRADLEGICRRLREIVHGIDPEAVEVVRLGDRAATYGVGTKKMSEGYVYIIPQSRHVNLGFYRGADLPDPDGLLEGTGRAMRHVKIRDAAGADQPAIRDLVAAAVKERREAQGR